MPNDPENAIGLLGRLVVMFTRETKYPGIRACSVGMCRNEIEGLPKDGYRTFAPSPDAEVEIVVSVDADALSAAIAKASAGAVE